MGVNGRSTVETSLTQEKIVGSPDMTPEPSEPGQGGRAGDLNYPTCDVAGQEINTGADARASRSTCGSTRSRPPAG